MSDKNLLTLKVWGFVEHKHNGVHNFSTDQLSLAFSNTAPKDEANDPTEQTEDAILANVTEVDYTNLGSRLLTTVNASQFKGQYNVHVSPVSILVSGGSFGPFRYMYVYNPDATAVTNPLIVAYDFGEEYSINDGESLDIIFDPIAGLFVAS